MKDVAFCTIKGQSTIALRMRFVVVKAMLLCHTGNAERGSENERSAPA
jgi:hypothetical protein